MDTTPEALQGGQAGEPRTVQSVARAAELLKALGRLSRPTSLSDLSRRVGLSKPATYNLLKTLEVEGLISKDEDARYQLSWGMYELGSAVARSVQLTKLARFHLGHLAEMTGEAVLLGIIDKESVLYLDRGQAESATFTMMANIGRRHALHSNASGKVLLASLPEDHARKILHGALRPFTSKTITDPDELAADLERVTKRGYATNWEEQEVGLSSISVPIRNQADKVVAALTLAAPAKRLNVKTLPKYLVPLQTEARLVSGKLGWQDPSSEDDSQDPEG
jgi:DNA-binding IclR family transcriptional regulator